MKSLLSPNLVKQSLSSHSWLGLLVGALMYLTCLSGTIAVLYTDFERWEQPTVEEFLSYDSSMADIAYEEMLSRELENGAESTHHVYFTFPIKGIPRATIATDTNGWFINQDGTLGEEVSRDWTHLLTNLHNTFHLPISYGYIVVSTLGALLCGLIVSGFLAHPSIFKEAFSFRRQKSKRIEQVDLHNRLSVWGAPFFLMIAITGAFFGLTLLFRTVAGVAFFDGDGLDASDAIYGAEPVLNQVARQPAVGKALAYLQDSFEDEPPLFLTVDGADDLETVYLIAGVRHYGRLIWGEQHLFDSSGTYIDNVGYSDGEIGRQTIYSMYRLHFGHFSGWLSKVLYIVFGLAMTVVSATGINIWLVRRKTRDYLNNLWVGVVWGTPAGLALTAVASVLQGLPSIAIFWLGTVAAMAMVQWLDNEALGKKYLQLVTGSLLGILVAGHIFIFGMASVGSAALVINLILLSLAIWFLISGLSASEKSRVERKGASLV